MEQIQSQFFLRAITNCYNCWELNVESNCYSTCANEYMIYLKGKILIDEQYQMCNKNSKLISDQKCLKEQQLNHESLLKFINKMIKNTNQ